jgi:ribosomal protein S18 acetylase RimI-like enzyme
MWVAPEARRLGAARALLGAVRAWAAEAGAAELRLHVVSTQHAARALYEGCGFGYTGRSEIGRRDPGQVLLEMAVSLTGP